jgi:hypothetical protein
MPWPDAGMHRRWGIELGFTDARGRHWIRRVGGELERIRTNPVDHYALPLPIDWTLPTQRDGEADPN